MVLPGASSQETHSILLWLRGAWGSPLALKSILQHTWGLSVAHPPGLFTSKGVSKMNTGSNAGLKKDGEPGSTEKCEADLLEQMGPALK